MQSGFLRAKAADFKDVPLAYDNPLALHEVTHGTTRLLPDESVKAGPRLGPRWSSVCVCDTVTRDM